MRKKLQKTGGYSRALVIPVKFLKAMRWDEQKTVELSMEDETLRVRVYDIHRTEGFYNGRKGGRKGTSK